MSGGIIENAFDVLFSNQFLDIDADIIRVGQIFNSGNFFLVCV